MSQSIVTADPATVKLDLMPINREWILEGTPRARANVLVISQDDTICTMVWDGAAGRFGWLSADDEIVHIISGDVVIIDERNLNPDDMGLFPAGSTSARTSRVASCNGHRFRARRGARRPLPCKYIAAFGNWPSVG